jgi:hypothetical protein
MPATRRPQPALPAPGGLVFVVLLAIGGILQLTRSARTPHLSVTKLEADVRRYAPEA